MMKKTTVIEILKETALEKLKKMEANGEITIVKKEEPPTKFTNETSNEDDGKLD